MTRRKILMAAGSFVLGIAGFFSADAYKKYVTNVTTAWFRTFGGTFLTLFHASAVCTHLTTVSSAVKTATAYFATVQGGVLSIHQLYITNSAVSNKKIYAK